MNTGKAEYRSYSMDFRLEETDGVRTLTGYAVVWGQPSEDLGGWVDVIRPGAFGDLTGKDILAFYNHDWNYLLARTASGTLRLDQDDKGLSFSLDLAQTPKAEEVYQLVKRGDIQGCSFTAIVLEEEWSDDGRINNLVKMELLEISPVILPAFLQTSVVTHSRDHLSKRPKPRYRSLDLARAIIALDDDE